MSHASPPASGRTAPRWSRLFTSELAQLTGSPWSRAGLPGSSAWVRVVPAGLSASGARSGSAVVKPALGPAVAQAAGAGHSRLCVPAPIAPEQLSAVLLEKTVLVIPSVMPGSARTPPPLGAWLSATVTLYRLAWLAPPAYRPPPETEAKLPDRVTLASVRWPVPVTATAPPMPAEWLPLKTLPVTRTVPVASNAPPGQLWLPPKRSMHWLSWNSPWVNVVLPAA